MKSKDDDRVPGPGVEHGAEGFLADEGGVRIQDNRFAGGVGKKRSGLGDGVGGAMLGVLNGSFDGFAVG